LVAIETTRFDIRYYHLIVRVDYAVFGLLATDPLLNLILVKGIKGLGNYLFSLEGLVDIVSAIPIVIILLRLDQLYFLKLTFGIAAFLKIARFSDALSIFKDVIITERKSILASLYLMMLLTFSISTIFYFVERDTNPNGFSSILESMWWSIVTLATVGYGDVVPVTALGKLLGALASIIGLGMFALPAGILANGFAQELANQIHYKLESSC
jgi:voltage-gated potassium channel